MHIALRFGRSELPLALDDDLDVQVLHLHPLPPLLDAAGAVKEALTAPIGGPPLAQLAQGRSSACIVICDVTRPVPNALLLQPILECLHDCGLKREAITILIATGLHRPNVGAELEEMIGKEIKDNYRVLNHDARDETQQRDLGEIAFDYLALDDDAESDDSTDDSKRKRVARVALNRAYCDSDLKITTGLIEPHLMAGYSGGRKLVCPGVASAQTIMQFHAPPMIGHQCAHAGNLRDNPVHAMSRAVAEQVGVDFIANVTLSEDRQVTGVFCGDLDAAHQAGVAHVERSSKVPCRAADIVVTSGAGYPLDTTLYQIVKGMVGALPAVRAGGTIIIAAAMEQGIGGPEFTALCREVTTVDGFIERLYESEVVIDQWQLQEMMQVLQKCRVVIVTADEQHDTLLKACLLQPERDLQDAVDYALREYGADATITVIPEGPYVTPAPQSELVIA